MPYYPPPASGGSGFPIAGAGTTVATPANAIKGSGTYNSLMTNGDDYALAFGKQGEAFPRFTFSTGGVGDMFNFGDGTYDPWNEPGPSIGINTGADDHRLDITSQTSRVSVGVPDTVFTDSVVGFGSALLLPDGSGTFGSVHLTAGPGAPGIAGAVGDIYIRSNGGVLSTIYRCTVAGATGLATWTGIL